MFHKNLFCVLVISASIKLLHSAEPVRMESTALGKGPEIPLNFTSTHTQHSSLSPIDHDVYEDARLSAPQLAIKRGYNTETHRVVTPDGYILEMHRIVSTPTIPAAFGKKVVFLQHGFLDSSATWVMSGPEHGFGYLLADAGYDVWMGNARGNIYSRKHLLYDPDGSPSDRAKFWTFTWHEIGVYDLPTMIDYVLKKTRQQKMFYAGHSQGNTAFYVMCSEKPQYNAKIKMMHALAPVAYMKNAKSPVLKIIELAPAAFQRATAMLGAYEFLPTLDIFTLLGQQICRDTSPFIGLCESVLFLITGFNERNLNATLFPVYLSHTPAGAATFQLLHFIQEAETDSFRKFDWRSPAKNMEMYGSVTPPKYNLKNVVTRVILHYSDNDWLAAVEDVHKLYLRLPNAELDHMSDLQFEHMDFVWGIDAREILYEPIIASMKLYDRLVGSQKKAQFSSKQNQINSNQLVKTKND